MARTPRFRLAMLLAMLLLACTTMSPSLVYAQEDDAMEEAAEAASDAAEEAAAAAAAAQEAAAAKAAAAEAAARAEADRLAEEAAAAAAAASAAATEAKESAENLISNVKGQISDIMNKVASSSNSALDRIKSVDKKDAKKIAAVGLGLFGIKVGVGWLQGTGAPEPEPIKKGWK